MNEHQSGMRQTASKQQRQMMLDDCSSTALDRYCCFNRRLPPLCRTRKAAGCSVGSFLPRMRAASVNMGANSKTRQNAAAARVISACQSCLPLMYRLMCILLIACDTCNDDSLEAKSVLIITLPKARCLWPTAVDWRCPR